MELLFPLRWERNFCEITKFDRFSNIINVQVTGINKFGTPIIINKKYKEWLGVCTGKIDKVISDIQKYFPTCTVKCVKLKESNFKKVLPYFKDRLASKKLKYSSKPFYKLYLSAPIEDVGFFFDKQKISYFEKQDWLTRLYIDLCVRFDSFEFYYKWYKVNDSKLYLMDSFEMMDYNPPNLTIGAFDLETVPLDGENRVPTGHHVDDRIVMISLVKWNSTVDKTLLFLNPIEESLQLQNTSNVTYMEFFSEKEMLQAFHELLEDVHVLTGYNINQFDLPCLFARLTWLHLDALLEGYYSRTVGKHLVTTYQNKLVIDMYNFIETFSKYGLPSFKLDDVVKHKLNEEKIQINPTAIHYWYSQPEKLTRSLLLSEDNEECFNVFQPSRVRESEFGTFLKYMEYCLHDSVLVYKLFCHEEAFIFLLERSNVTALNVEQSLHYGNSKYIYELFKTYSIHLGFFVNTTRFKNTIEEDSQDLRSFFVGKKNSTYQGALNFCTPCTFHKNTCVFDFTSMYPSVMLNHNLCYGTSILLSVEKYKKLAPEIRQQCMALPYRNHSEDDFVIPNKFPKNRYEHPAIDFDKDTTLMVWYKEEKGFLPQLVEHFLKKRKELKKMKGVIYHNKQLTIKLVLNSMYGCMGATDSPLGYIYIAMMITAFARSYILASAEFFTTHKKMVIYSDTDSIFVRQSSQDESRGRDENQIKSLIEDGNLVNTYLNQPHVHLAFESIYDCLLIISKKRYIYEEKGVIYKKGFEQKSNKLVRWMSGQFNEKCMTALKNNIREPSIGWSIWTDILVTAYSMCKDPRRFCITRKTKPLSEYKSTTCPQLRLLSQHPEKAGGFIDYTYSQADISKAESVKWIMQVEDCKYVHFEKLFISQKQIWITLLNIVFFNTLQPETILRLCNNVLNTMKWKNFMNAEFKSFLSTGKNIMILTEKGVDYTFDINDV